MLFFNARENGVAKVSTCATAASNQQVTTLTHVFLSINHVLALNVAIYLGNFVSISNAELIEPNVAPKSA